MRIISQNLNPTRYPIRTYAVEQVWIPAPRFYEDKLRGNDDRPIVFKCVTPAYIKIPQVEPP